MVCAYLGSLASNDMKVGCRRPVECNPPLLINEIWCWEIEEESLGLTIKNKYLGTRMIRTVRTYTPVLRQF
jgi:hypothetical protein